MEAIGVVGSIIAIVQLTGKISALGYGYLSELSSATEDLQSFLDELGSFRVAVRSLQKFADANPSSEAIHLLDGSLAPNGSTLENCALELEELRLTLKKSLDSRTGRLKWPLKTKEAERCVSRLERYKSLFNLVLATNQITQLQEISEMVKGLAIGADKMVQDTTTMQAVAAAEMARAAEEREKQTEYRKEGAIHRKEQVRWWEWEKSRKMEIEKREKERHKIDTALLRLSSMNHRSSCDRARSFRCDGTGDWLVKTDVFEKWIASQLPNTFWLHGIAGAGKTVLTTSLIDYLLETHLKRKDGKTAICYFMGDFMDQESLRSQTVFCSLARQLLSSQETIPDSMSRAFEKLLYRSLSSGETIQLLRDSIYLHERVFIILDGIDEMSKDEQSRLLEELDTLMEDSKGDGVIKLYLASRWPYSSHRFPSGALTLSLGSSPSSSLESDIRLYVQAEFRRRVQRRRLIFLDPALEKEIEEKLVEGCDGMFLWVRLQLDEISRERTDAGIRRALNDMPRGIELTYGRIFARILRDNNWEVAKRVFTWISVAKRPLTIYELCEAITIQPGDKQIHPSRMSNDWLLVLEDCESLIYTYDDDDKVYLSHFTVREYIQKADDCPLPFRIREDVAMKEVSTLCMTILNFDMFETRVTMHDASGLAPSQRTAIYKTNPMDYAINAVLSDFSRDNRIATLLRAVLRLFRRNIEIPPITAQDSGADPLNQSRSKLGNDSSNASYSHQPLILSYVKEAWFEQTLRYFEVSPDDFGDKETVRMFLTLLKKQLPFRHFPGNAEDTVFDLARRLDLPGLIVIWCFHSELCNPWNGARKFTPDTVCLWAMILEAFSINLEIGLLNESMNISNYLLGLVLQDECQSPRSTKDILIDSLIGGWAGRLSLLREMLTAVVDFRPNVPATFLQRLLYQLKPDIYESYELLERCQYKSDSLFDYLLGWFLLEGTSAKTYLKNMKDQDFSSPTKRKLLVEYLAELTTTLQWHPPAVANRKFDLTPYEDEVCIAMSRNDVQSEKKYNPFYMRDSHGRLSPTNNLSQPESLREMQPHGGYNNPNVVSIKAKFLEWVYPKNYVDLRTETSSFFEDAEASSSDPRLEAAISSFRATVARDVSLVGVQRFFNASCFPPHSLAMRVFDEDGRNVLHICIAKRKIWLVELAMKKYGVSLRSTSERSGRNALHFAVEYLTSRQCIDLAQFCGFIHVNSVDHRGWTALHYAISSRKYYMARALIKKAKANLTALDSEQRHPLFFLPGATAVEDDGPSTDQISSYSGQDLAVVIRLPRRHRYQIFELCRLHNSNITELTLNKTLSSYATAKPTRRSERWYKFNWERGETLDSGEEICTVRLATDSYIYPT